MKVSSRRIALPLLVLLLAAGASGGACAQSPVTAEHASRPALPMSVADMQARLQARASGIDANRDGYLVAEELQAHGDARRQERMQKRMARLDLDRDGRVSTREFEAGIAARVQRADADRDGQITREEVRALREERRDRQRGPRDPS